MGLDSMEQKATPPEPNMQEPDGVHRPKFMVLLARNAITKTVEISLMSTVECQVEVSMMGFENFEGVLIRQMAPGDELRITSGSK